MTGGSVRFSSFYRNQCHEAFLLMMMPEDDASYSQTLCNLGSLSTSWFALVQHVSELHNLHCATYLCQSSSLGRMEKYIAQRKPGYKCIFFNSVYFQYIMVWPPNLSSLYFTPTRIADIGRMYKPYSTYSCYPGKKGELHSAFISLFPTPGLRLCVSVYNSNIKERQILKLKYQFK